MKKNFFYLLLIASIIFSCNITYSQNSSTKTLNKYGKMLVGTWKVDSISIDLSRLAPEYQTIFKEKMNAAAKNATVIISEDRRYKTTGINNDLEGLWGISEDGKVLTIKSFDDAETIEKTKIVSLSENILIMQKFNDSSTSNKIFLHKEK